MQTKYRKLERSIPNYVEETKKDKLKIETGRRAISFEERNGKGKKILYDCTRDMRIRDGRIERK